MDVVASCKDKLAYFRIKELKDVLGQLGLSKQGKKQDLIDRILAVVSNDQVSKIWLKKNTVGKEEVAKLVDDTYRKMQVSGATDLVSKGQGASDSKNIKIKGEIADPFHSNIKVCCPCGSSLETESMIKCEGSRCQVWQHISCVIIPEKPIEGIPPVPDVFYCEICRLRRADPFLEAIAHPLFPVKLTVTKIPVDGTNPVQSVEKTFQLNKDFLMKQEYDVQAWCMLLNDKVPFRMHWPLHTDLQVNGIPVRAIFRPGSQQLGANGRDDGPIITPCTKEGINKITLTGCDARVFCLGVRLVRRRTVQQIMSMIPKESDGERFEDALARVCRCIGGGNAADGSDSDSDIEVVADFFGVNLRCPNSGSRMKVAGRFKPCVHMGCFDLEVFVELNQRSRKWQCPSCLKNYSLENVIIDPYYNRITSKMRNCGEDVTEIEVKPDGSWRVKAKTDYERKELGDLAKWHNPDSTLCATVEGEVKPSVEMLKQVKQEGASDGHTVLKLGIRKNSNGLWEVSKPEDMCTSSGDRLRTNFQPQEQKVIPMSNSATGSGRDGDDASVNQNGETYEFTNNGIEFDAVLLNTDAAYNCVDQNQSTAVGNDDVIVLSDSDEDNNILMPSTSGYRDNHNDAGPFPFSTGPGISHSYPEDPHPSCLGPFNGNDDEFGLPLWPLHSGTQDLAGFQLFNSEADVSDALNDLQHDPMNCLTSMNGSYTLPPETTMLPASLDPGSSVGQGDFEINDGLVDNLLFRGDDPAALQIFLPTQPSGPSVQSEMRDQTDVSNGFRSDDWISLRLGGAATGDSGTPNGLNSRQQVPSRGGDLLSLDNSGSLLDMSDGRSEKASRPRSDVPLSFPRQKRSVRPRLLLTLSSDSE